VSASQQSPERRRLAGVRVLVTRAPEQAGELAALLEDAGARVVAVGLISFEAPSDAGPAHEALTRMADFDVVVISSANAARGIAAVAETMGPGLPAMLAGGPRVVAAGPATAAALIELGVGGAEVPSTFSAAGVAAHLGSSARAMRVLIPRAEEGLDWLPRSLREQGAAVTVVPVYRTVAAHGVGPSLAKALRGVDAVTFASPSAVTAFIDAGGQGALAPGVLVACIGPTTAEAATAAGLAPVAVATNHSAAGLVAAISDYLAS
jgi:uroporphyrinogen-III synthase